MKRFLVLAVFSAIVFSSCDYIHGKRIRGNGVIKKESRPAGEFAHVEVSGAIDLFVKQDAERSINIEADENLLPYIEVRNEGGRLSIFSKEGFNLDASKSIKAYVSSPVFKELEASGASSITSESTISSTEAMKVGLSGASNAGLELKCIKLTANLSGASEMTLNGEAKDLRITGSGSSHVKGFGLVADNAVVDISGASSAEIYANTNLEAKASGASNVRYKGSANFVAHTSGAGSAKKME